MDAMSSVIGYMKHKNATNRGFLKYGYFKRLICYILDFHKDYYIRKIFLKMCKKGYFIKSEGDKKTFKYKFNPNPEIQYKKEIINKREPVIVTFD
tara:strand:+ start:721 stop:1005 length:285 start_codon:yes stop_codon:yes gene_type:complete